MLHQVDSGNVKGVALFLKHGFDFFKTRILDQDIILALPVVDMELNPGRILKYTRVLSQAIGTPVVMVFQVLESYQRLRYIKKRVPFVVPGQQIYIPKLLIDFKSKTESVIKPRNKFRPATQFMLFHHLYFHDLNGMQQRNIAHAIQYSEMTVSRAVQELEKVEVIRTGKHGVEFIPDRIKIWNKTKQYLRSPVRELLYAEDVIPTHEFCTSGINALAQYTNISGEKNVTYAIPVETYKYLKDRNLNSINQFEGSFTIELWFYNPALLSKNKFVDPFSLFMSMVDQQDDERISKSLDQILEKFL